MGFIKGVFSYNTSFSSPIFEKWLHENYKWFRDLSKYESVKFLLIESVICLFIDSPVKKYIPLLNL